MADEHVTADEYIEDVLIYVFICMSNRRDRYTFLVFDDVIVNR